MKKKVITGIIIILGIFAIAFLSFEIYSNYLLNNINIEEIDEQDIIEENVVVDNSDQAHEVVNIMLIGADNANKNYNSTGEEKSDVFKIVSLDYTDSKVKITSLDKNVIAWIPDKSSYAQLNMSYVYGGAKYALNTLNYNLDLDVTKYISFSFAGFIDVIDKLGGIDIKLTKQEAQAMNNPAYGNKVSIYAKEGENHMYGNDALTYARINYIGSDYLSMDRQNKVIKAVVNKLKSSSLDDVLNTINVCLPYITTNLTTSEIKSYISDVLKFDLTDIQTQNYPKDCASDMCKNKNKLGGYILRSYSNEVIELHKYIYGTSTYEPTKTIYDNEKKVYEDVCNFYE